MKNLRIYVPIFNFYPIFGGAEKQAEKIFTELVKLGVEVHIITAKQNNNTPASEIYKGINIIRLPFIYNGEIQLFKKISSFIFMLEVFLFLVLNRNKYDILQNFFIDKYTFITVLCSILFKKPVIIREANISKSVKGKENFDKSLIQRLLYKIYRKSSAIIALTEEIQEEFINIFKFCNNKIHIIPNGVENFALIEKKDVRKKLGLKDDALIGIIAARLDKQKNHIAVFKAWKHLVNNYPDATLICLGAGQEKNYYQTFINDIDCKDNIILAGTKNNISEYYQAADFFILPSFYEGMSNALLEAMNLGIPCIVSDIRANRFLITNNENGVLFDLDIDDKALADLIVNLYKNRDLLMKLSNNAKIKAKEFSINSISGIYLELYKSLLSKN
jgi:glycosyltransferase involved in cell wall biosynthesis